MPLRSPSLRTLRRSAGLLLLPLLASLGAAQDGGRNDERGKDDPPKVEKKEAVAEVVDDKTAKQLLKDEKEALSSKEPRVRKEALERLARYSNEALVKTFGTKLKDRDPRVVTAAIQAIAHQPGAKAQGSLLRLFRDKRIKDDESLSSEVAKALSRTGWERKSFVTLREYYDDAPPKTKKELLKAFTAQKEVQAFSLFVDNLDEPRPENVNSPSNPPASYWKARYKEWTFVKAEVRRGLEAVAGRGFENAEEARDWARTREARKLKIRYKSGS